MHDFLVLLNFDQVNKTGKKLIFSFGFLNFASFSHFLVWVYVCERERERTERKVHFLLWVSEFLSSFLISVWERTFWSVGITIGTTAFKEELISRSSQHRQLLLVFRFVFLFIIFYFFRLFPFHYNYFRWCSNKNLIIIICSNCVCFWMLFWFLLNQNFWHLCYVDKTFHRRIPVVVNAFSDSEMFFTFLIINLVSQIHRIFRIWTCQSLKLPERLLFLFLFFND